MARTVRSKLGLGKDFTADMNISDWQKEVYRLECEKGWTSPGAPRNIGEQISLVHSELSEGLEEERAGRPHLWYQDNGKPEGLGPELADVVIRVMGLCEFKGIDLEEMISLKHQFNKNRPHRHGGKLF